jgi:myosin heavy subunit
MKNFKMGLVVAILTIGAAMLIVIQYEAQIKLRAENESLRQQMTQLQTDNESLSNRLAAAGNSHSLADDQLNELLRLRGEVGMLRRQLTELGKLQKENQQLKTQITSQNQSVQLPTEAEYRQRERYVVDSMKQLGLTMRLYSDKHNNQYATNFDQLTNKLAGSFTIDGKANMDIIESQSDMFEFVNAGLVSFDYPQMVMFRERIPRRTPDGKWERAYGLADGSVQTATSDNGNFDAWEKQNTFSPPPNQ